jgi:hypothetical protein
MKHRLVLVLVLVLVGAAACATLVGGAAAGPGDNGRLFTFAGELLADPGPNASSVSVRVETGNKPALRALIGGSQNQVFAVGSGTEVLLWSNGVPHVGSTGDLHAGDYVTVRVRAPRGFSLQEIESRQAATVADRAAPGGNLPLWLFVGTVAGPQSGGKVNLHVDSGNWKALHAMLGQPLDQSFAYDDGTIFLRWQGRVPTVIDPSQLKAGDRITVRVRAARNAELGQVEATPAKHVGDHEPAPPPQQ